MLTPHKFLNVRRRWRSFQFTLFFGLALILLVGGQWTGWSSLATASKAAATGSKQPIKALILPLAQPANAGDGYLTDGITTASVAACANTGMGLWNLAATEQKSVFSSTFSPNGLPIGVSTNEGTFLKDVNGDGKEDIVFILDAASGANAGTYVWLGNGNGSFATAAVEKKTYTSTLSGGKIETGACWQASARTKAPIW